MTNHEFHPCVMSHESLFWIACEVGEVSSIRHRMLNSLSGVARRAKTDSMLDVHFPIPAGADFISALTAFIYHQTVWPKVLLPC